MTEGTGRTDARYISVFRSDRYHVDIYRSGIGQPVSVRLTDTRSGRTYLGQSHSEFLAREAALAQVPRRVEIDLNVRVWGNRTVAGFEDCEGWADGAQRPTVGDVVEVFAPLDPDDPRVEAYGPGKVMTVDLVRNLLFIEVDWQAMQRTG
jgi:hypothetical protein